jgi:hypothetical protein
MYVVRPGKKKKTRQQDEEVGAQPKASVHSYIMVAMKAIGSGRLSIRSAGLQSSKISLHFCGLSGAKSRVLFPSRCLRSIRMTDKMHEHSQEGDENMSLASDISEGLERVKGSDKDTSYTKRMLARRRIEMMRDEKELEKQLTDLDWPEGRSLQSS